MNITLTVPEATCAKCNTTAPVLPSILWPDLEVRPQFRQLLTAVSKDEWATKLTARDDAGTTWQALSGERPAGWAVLPTGQAVCAECNAMWLEWTKAFLAPVAVEPVALEVAAPPVDFTPTVIPPRLPSSLPSNVPAVGLKHLNSEGGKVVSSRPY